MSDRYVEPEGGGRPEEEPLDAADVLTLSAVRRIYEVGDPVPPGLLGRVKFAITLDNLEAEVAQLQRDAAEDLVTARSEDMRQAQTVTFTSETLTTMVTVTPLTSGAVRIDGWVAPAASMDVEVRSGDRTRKTTADEDGRFVFEEHPRGLAQFILRPGEGGRHLPVVTPAIEL